MLQIKRWSLMLLGKSVWHVNQDLGKCFSEGSIKGYYNNMTEKVTMMPELLESDELPTLSLGGGKHSFFPVAIFQYGLGAYDLFLLTGDERYERKFMQCVMWAKNHLDDFGRWSNFSHYSPETPFSAMAQGEGTSLLVRAFIHTGSEEYLGLAKRALDFMLSPIEKGGTTKYDKEDAFLMEYTFKGMVLNGSIFSWWGLYDYVLCTGNKGKYETAMKRTLQSLIDVLPRFDNSYWSMYSLDGLISSPFYHNLHIAQMQALYALTGQDIFNHYANRWTKQQNNPFCKSLAFVNKAFQKIAE